MSLGKFSGLRRPRLFRSNRVEVCGFKWQCTDAWSTGRNATQRKPRPQARTLSTPTLAMRSGSGFWQSEARASRRQAALAKACTMEDRILRFRCLLEKNVQGLQLTALGSSSTDHARTMGQPSTSLHVQVASPAGLGSP